MARRKLTNSRFAEIPAPTLNRSLFKRQFGNKFTLDEGYLVPVHLDEIYAGDTVNINQTCFIRMTTPITPVMDNLELDLHAFFVPARLVMKDYYKVLGEQNDPLNPAVAPLIPQITATTFTEGSLADYFGLPTKIAIPQEDMPIALPFRAYNLIYNDWFRDENLQSPVTVNTSTGNSNISEFTLLRRNKKHDYFTSCLPFAQKGDAVDVGFGGQAALVGRVPLEGKLNTLWYGNAPAGDSFGHNGLEVRTGQFYNSTSSSLAQAVEFNFSKPDRGGNYVRADLGGSYQGNFAYADLSTAGNISINDLRNAISVQHILERRARGGTRDVEILQNTYGVSPLDDRMQRPELIGVSRANLNMSTVVQTSESTSNSPLGDLSAMGTITANLKFSYSAVENGFLIILASARAEISYQQGMPRLWSKRTFLDIMDPMRSHIGEQPVYRKEIYMTDSTGHNNQVFGYRPNFDDMRFGRNQISGKFRSNATDSLDIWHFSQQFGNAPVLSSEFIKQNSPVSRALAVQNYPHFFGDSFIKCNHFRVLPTHGTPGLRRI